MMTTFLLFVLLGTLIFILLIPKTSLKDHFQLQNQTSRSLYQSSNKFESDMKTLFTTLNDNDDMLLMAGCYQLPPNNRSMFPKDCLQTSATLYTASFDEVRSKIMSMLLELKARNKGTNLADPVYVLIEQAPYMRDDKGNVLSMQYNVRSYMFEPVNIMRTGASAEDLKRPLFVRITIFLTKYYNNMSPRLTPQDIRMTLFPYRSKKDQCYIGCIGDTSGSFCGCLNRDVVNGDNKSYASKCSSTPIPVNGGTVDMTKNVEADFAILYTLNTRASSIVSLNIFA